MSKILKHIDGLGYIIVPRVEWDDCLDELLEDEYDDVHWDGNVLKWNNDECELVYVKINNILVALYYGWIPLWRLNMWKECEVNDQQWNDLGTKFFAMCMEDNDESLEKVEEELSVINFQVSNFEGF